MTEPLIQITGLRKAFGRKQVLTAWTWTCPQARSSGFWA
jgi:hypothetical protein